MKDLVCLLFELDDKAQNFRHYDLYRDLRRHVDDEYHSIKGPVPFG